MDNAAIHDPWSAQATVPRPSLASSPLHAWSDSNKSATQPSVCYTHTHNERQWQQDMAAELPGTLVSQFRGATLCNVQIDAAYYRLGNQTLVHVCLHHFPTQCFEHGPWACNLSLMLQGAGGGGLLTLSGVQVLSCWIESSPAELADVNWTVAHNAPGSPETAEKTPCFMCLFCI